MDDLHITTNGFAINYKNQIKLYSKDFIDFTIYDFTFKPSNDDCNTFDYEFPELVLSDNEAQILSSEFNNYNMLCIVVQVPKLSKYRDWHTYIADIYDGIFKYFTRAHGLKETQHIAILEKSPNKMWHIHILVCCSQTILKKHCKNLEIEKSGQRIIHNEEVPQMQPADALTQVDTILTHIDDYRTVVTCQIIKSNASYFHYLRKNIYYIWSDSPKFLKMFCNFKRTHIFPDESVPKTQKGKITKVNCKDAVILLLYRLFDEGKLSWDDIITDIRIQPYLIMSNLKTIYTNCFSNFVNQLNHIKNLVIILKKFHALPKGQHCACAVLQALEWQSINIEDFMYKLFKWLNGAEKANALLFIGPPDCGKSYLANSIWKHFLLKTRIVPDGIFSFANLIGSGCALWDEPMIAADMADQTKLILEGEPNVAITIKNQKSQNLGKRVPIIITSNHELSRYCTKDKDAFDVRTYKFTFHQPYNNGKQCTSKTHFCPHLDTANRTNNPFTDDDDSDNQGESVEDQESKTCQGLHSVNDNQTLSLLVLALVLYRKSFNINNTSISLDDFKELAHLIKEVDKLDLFCFHSRYLKTSDSYV